MVWLHFHCVARAGAGWICVSGAGSQCGDRARRAAVRKFFHPRCTEGASPSRLAILVPSFRLDEGKRGGTSSLWFNSNSVVRYKLAPITVGEYFPCVLRVNTSCSNVKLIAYVREAARGWHCMLAWEISLPQWSDIFCSAVSWVTDPFKT